MSRKAINGREISTVSSVIMFASSVIGAPLMCLIVMARRLADPCSTLTPHGPGSQAQGFIS